MAVGADPPTGCALLQRVISGLGPGLRFSTGPRMPPIGPCATADAWARSCAFVSGFEHIDTDDKGSSIYRNIWRVCIHRCWYTQVPAAPSHHKFPSPGPRVLAQTESTINL